MHTPFDTPTGRDSHENCLEGRVYSDGLVHQQLDLRLSTSGAQKLGSEFLGMELETQKAGKTGLFQGPLSSGHQKRPV
jgi:hypothetical protein